MKKSKLDIALDYVEKNRSQLFKTYNDFTNGIVVDYVPDGKGRDVYDII